MQEASRQALEESVDYLSKSIARLDHEIYRKQEELANLVKSRDDKTAKMEQIATDLAELRKEASNVS